MEGNAETNRNAYTLKGKIVVLPKVDKTLTKEGFAADAKVTGDRLAAVYEVYENGTVRKDFKIEKSSPLIDLVNTESGRMGEAHYSNSNNLILANKKDDDNLVGIWIKPEYLQPDQYLGLGTYIDGVFTDYQIYGEYNKPRGKYTGTGAEASPPHTILIGGIGSTLKISTTKGMAIVTGAGAICKKYSSTEVYGIEGSACRFDGGILYLATNDEVVNGEREYWYEVL